MAWNAGTGGPPPPHIRRMLDEDDDDDWTGVDVYDSAGGMTSDDDDDDDVLSRHDADMEWEDFEEELPVEMVDPVLLEVEPTVEYMEVGDVPVYSQSPGGTTRLL